MKRLFICLVLILSVAAAPVAYAADWGCQDEVGSVVDHVSKEKKQDDGKTTKADHVCCCQHVLGHSPLKVEVFIQKIPSSFTLKKQTNLASLNVGPLLEPPSHV